MAVRSATDPQALDRFDYHGGFVSPSSPVPAVADESVFFSWADVTPQAVLAVRDGTPAAVGSPDVTVGYLIISRDHRDGAVTIRAYVEGDTGTTYVEWDATGTMPLNVQ